MRDPSSGLCKDISARWGLNVWIRTDNGARLRSEKPLFWGADCLLTSLDSAQLRLQIEITHQSVQILGMNAEQSCSLGKTALCFSQRAKNQLFFCRIEHIVVSRSA